MAAYSGSDKRLQYLFNASGNLADDYDPTNGTYAVGDFAMADGVLKKCNTAISSPEPYDSSKWDDALITDNLGGGGGGSSTFAGLTDVSLSNLQNGQVPKYNSTSGKWENANESGGGSANIWTGTQAEYEAQASQIPDGTQVNITDDEENVKALDIYPADANPIVIGKYGNRDIKRKRIYLATLATGSNAIGSQLPLFEILIGFHGYCKTNETYPRYMQINSDINTANWWCAVQCYGNYQGSPIGNLWVGSQFNNGSAEIWIDYVEASS